MLKFRLPADPVRFAIVGYYTRSDDVSRRYEIADKYITHPHEFCLKARFIPEVFPKEGNAEKYRQYIGSA